MTSSTFLLEELAIDLLMARFCEYELWTDNGLTGLSLVMGSMFSILMNSISYLRLNSGSKVELGMALCENEKSVFS